MEGRKIVASIATVLIFSSLQFKTNANLVNAADSGDVIAELNQEQQLLQGQYNDLNNKLSNIRSDISKSRAYRNNINSQLATLQAQINVENQKISILDEQIKEKQDSIDQMNQEIDSNMQQLKSRLNVIYRSGDVAVIDIILGSRGFDDLIDTANLIQKLGSYDSKLIAGLKDQIANVAADNAEIEKNREEVSRAKDILDQKKGELLDLQSQSDKALSDLNGQASNLRLRMNSNSSERRRIDAQIMRANSTKEQSVNTANYTKGRYIWPVPSSRRITAGWGDGRNHKAIDIGAPTGTPIVAAADGVVVKAVNSGWGGGYGLHLQLCHGSGCETLYGHCSKLLVTCGQAVKQGQVIAYVGSTGRSTGPHLHFETKRNGRQYNPRTEVG